MVWLTECVVCKILYVGSVTYFSSDAQSDNVSMLRVSELFLIVLYSFLIDLIHVFLYICKYVAF